MQDEQELSEDDVIQDVLGENPRASQLRLMRSALEERRSTYRAQLEHGGSEQEIARIKSKLKPLDKQIDALRQEEAITEFVETSVKVTLTKSALEDDG